MRQKMKPKKSGTSQRKTKSVARATAKGRTRSKRAASDPRDILSLIRQDHLPLKRLIKTMKDSDAEMEELRGAFEEFVPLLLMHAKPEERALYQRMKELDSLRAEGFEGSTEHHIADQLVGEIRTTVDADKWRARVKVLAELVEHHLEEEEEEVFKEVRKEFGLVERIQMGEDYQRIRDGFHHEAAAA
jgi:hemerythrin superfamily protein